MKECAMAFVESANGGAKKLERELFLARTRFKGKPSRAVGKTGFVGENA
ncbi:hypothetical protein IAD21_00030 [Abditibacteriota bacterium]|nr:hypothetical protein IAD21_00030 [Abditibacteriota bacterium]